ncbi:MAG: V-type ATP synthase subunit F [Pseudomonadota bacterium]
MNDAGTPRSELRREPHPGAARLIAMGGSALMQGFSLIGFETWPDADEDTLDRVLGELLREHERALLFLEPELARCDCPAMRRVMNEGGRIVVTEIPPLEAPRSYEPEVERLLRRALPGGARGGR